MNYHAVDGMLVFEDFCIKRNLIVSLKAFTIQDVKKVAVKDVTGETHIILGKDAEELYELFTGGQALK